MRDNLEPGDEKNRRLALGRASWAEALSLSPADFSTLSAQNPSHGKNFLSFRQAVGPICIR